MSLKINNIKHLKKTRNSRQDHIKTYASFCNTNKKKQSVEKWLIPQKIINIKKDDSKIINGLMNKENFVIKIQTYDNITKSIIENEVKWNKRLNNLNNNNFIKYFCDFTCKDNIKKYNKNVAIKKICKKNNKNDKLLHFNIIELVKDGVNLKDFLTKVDSHSHFKSVLNQLILSYIQAYEKFNFLHGDMNYGNIIIRSTNNKTKEYKIRNKTYLINTHGIEPVYLDFGNSSESYNESWIFMDFNRLFQEYDRYLLNQPLRNQFNMFKKKFTTGKCCSINGVLTRLKPDKFY